MNLKCLAFSALLCFGVCALGCDNGFLRSPRPTATKKLFLYHPDDCEMSDHGFYAVEVKRTYHDLTEDQYIDDLILNGVIKDCPTPDAHEKPSKKICCPTPSPTKPTCLNFERE